VRTFSTAPKAIFTSSWANRHLIRTLVCREIAQRYRGSILGVLWSFFYPLFMLTVYTFVFSVVFNARWGSPSGSKVEFALTLFVGLMVFNFFADCLIKAPDIIVKNTNYVKKIVFPVEILPWVTWGSALFHFAVSFVVWLIFYLLFIGIPHGSAFLFPVILIPLSLFLLGLCWLISSLSVYLRDLSQVMIIVTRALLFLTPIFYPLSAVPEKYRLFIYLNPLSFLVEQSRSLMLHGGSVSWPGMALQLVASAAIACFGFAWFQKTRKGFADVL
jgi:lipopolysaccharide transport system permease protein